MSNRLETNKKLSPKRQAEKELHNALNRVALEKAGRSDGINYFLEMYIKRSFANDQLASSLLKYILPGVPLINHTTNQQFNTIKVQIEDFETLEKKSLTMNALDPETEVEYATDMEEEDDGNSKKG